MRAYSIYGTYPLTTNSSLQCRMDGAEEMARTAWEKSLRLGTPETGYFVGPGHICRGYRDLAARLATDVLTAEASA